jgi:amino acid transporter
MSVSESGAVAQDERLRRTLTTPKIVFLVIAAAAPLAAMVCTVPLAFALGNGAAVPAMFAFAGLTLLCFSVGYAAISRRIVNAGGFYSYISSGLGRPLAVGGGLIAVIAYNTATVGLVGAFAYFAQLIAASHGLNLPWEVWAGAGLVVVGFLGYRQIDISACCRCSWCARSAFCCCWTSPYWRATVPPRCRPRLLHHTQLQVSASVCR